MVLLLVSYAIDVQPHVFLQRAKCIFGTTANVFLTLPHLNEVISFLDHISTWNVHVDFDFVFLQAKR